MVATDASCCGFVMISAIFFFSSDFIQSIKKSLKNYHDDVETLQQIATGGMQKDYGILKEAGTKDNPADRAQLGALSFKTSKHTIGFIIRASRH